MPYLVDGNNLIAQLPGYSMNDGADRRRLAGLLSAFCNSRRARLTLFFDGEPAEGWLSTTHLGGLEVRHSGRGRSADDALLDRVRDSGAPANITLVTSDKALRERARHLGARVIQARRFREMMQEEAARSRGGTEKPERPEAGEVDYWLRVFGEDSEGGAARPSRRRRKSSR